MVELTKPQIASNRLKRTNNKQNGLFKQNRSNGKKNMNVRRIVIVYTNGIEGNDKHSTREINKYSTRVAKKYSTRETDISMRGSHISRNRENVRSECSLLAGMETSLNYRLRDGNFVRDLDNGLTDCK